MGVSYGFSIPMGVKREKGYILVPGLRTSRVAPIVNIGMSAPDWIKFLVSYAHYQKTDFDDTHQMNALIFNRTKGLFFQGLKWRILDPSDAAGYGIGINRLNAIGVLNGINPEETIGIVSQKLSLPLRRDVAQSFFQIFNPRVIARRPTQDLFKALENVASFSEPKRTYELISLTVDLIKEAVRKMPISEQNEIAGTIYQFVSVVELMGIDPEEISERQIIFLLCSHQPGEIPPHLSPSDIAAVFHEIVRNADSGALPILLSFIVADILGAFRTGSPEEILWEASHKLPSDSMIERHVGRLYQRVADLVLAKGFHSQVSRTEFMSAASCMRIRDEAVWWEYNLVLGRLEELMRDFVGPYRFQTPWSGKLHGEFVRLASNPTWVANAKAVLQRASELAFKIASQDMYTLIIDEELIGWFREIQTILGSNVSLDIRFRRLWEFSDRLSQQDDDPVATYDTKTDTVFLHKDPREANPYIQRSIVCSWMEKFGRIWTDVP